MKQWCKQQIKCERDTEKTWTCCAHLDSGRADECPYKESQIDPEHNLPRQTGTKGLYGLCQDYEAVENL